MARLADPKTAEDLVATFWDDFKRVVAAIKASGDPLIDGRLYDAEAKIACASATLFLKLPDGGWRLEPDSSEARQLARITQYDVNIALAKRYRAPLWAVEYAVFSEPTGMREADEFLAQREPADALGAAGESLRSLAQYLETRKKSDWREIRDRARDELVHTETLTRQFSVAFQSATKAHEPLKVGRVENWLWTVGFRCAWQGLPASRKTSDAPHWDAAWPARAADLARRSAVTILAEAQGIRFEESVSPLALLGYR